MQTMTLLNQTKIPVLGFGTYKITDPTLAKESVTEAICRGYRHVDTAAFYENEVAVGQAIRDTIAEGGLARKDLFVTSKVWKTENTYDKVMASFEKTMENLGLDYLDLYLVHWPASDAFDPDWKETNRQASHDRYLSERTSESHRRVKFFGAAFRDDFGDGSASYGGSNRNQSWIFTERNCGFLPETGDYC